MENKKKKIWVVTLFFKISKPLSFNLHTQQQILFFREEFKEAMSRKKPFEVDAEYTYHLISTEYVERVSIEESFKEENV